jgi:hypothetical protein
MEAINGSVAELIPSLKLEVIGSGDDWSLRDGSGNCVPFRDGIAIPSKADDPLAAASLVSMHGRQLVVWVCVFVALCVARECSPYLFACARRQLGSRFRHRVSWKAILVERGLLGMLLRKCPRQ